MIQYFSIFQLIIIANAIYQINNSINKFKTIFDFLLLPHYIILCNRSFIFIKQNCKINWMEIIPISDRIRIFYNVYIHSRIIHFN